MNKGISAEKIGKRLKNIREKYGYSLSFIEEKTGISKEDIEAFEEGKLSENISLIDIIQRYSRALGLNPIRLFEKDFKYPNVNFRAKFIGDNEKEIIQTVIDFIYLISDYYHDLTGEGLPKVPYYPLMEDNLDIIEDDNEAISHALKVIEKLKKDIPEFQNLKELLKKLKVYVLEVDLYNSIDGFSIYVPDKSIPVIIVNKRIKSVCRKRFTIAHELFHILSDRHKEFPPLAKKIALINEIGEKNLRIREKVANKFAQYMLVPFNEIEKLLRKNKNLFTEKNFKEELMKKYCVSEDVLDFIAKDFRLKTKSFNLKCSCKRIDNDFPNLLDLYNKLKASEEFDEEFLKEIYEEKIGLT